MGCAVCPWCGSRPGRAVALPHPLQAGVPGEVVTAVRAGNKALSGVTVDQGHADLV